MRSKGKGRKREAAARAGKDRLRRSPSREPFRNAPPHDGDLPDNYGETRVCLLCIDPHLVHVYWEVRRADTRRALRNLHVPATEAFPVLRFYDAALVGTAGAGRPFAFDVSVDLSEGSRYIPLWSHDKEYFVELGLTNGRGAFSVLARSNTEVVPPAAPSEELSISMMTVAPAGTGNPPALAVCDTASVVESNAEVIAPSVPVRPEILAISCHDSGQVAGLPSRQVSARQFDFCIPLENSFRYGTASSPQPQVRSGELSDPEA